MSRGFLLSQCCMFAVCAFLAIAHAQVIDPDVYRDTCGVIRDKGYPCENHHVVTKDQFILQVTRIPYSPFTMANANAPPGTNVTVPRPTTFLLSGIFCTTMFFLWSYSQALPYELSDAGYDVWLVNHRGRPFEPQTPNVTLHTYLTPSEPEFWDWTIDAVVEYDIPAAMDHIMTTSGLDTIAAFIGHSQGGIVGYAFFAAYQDTLAKKFDMFFPLGGLANDPRAQSPTSAPLKLSPSLFTAISKPDPSLISYKHQMMSTQAPPAPKPLTECPWCFGEQDNARGCCMLDYVQTMNGLWNLTIETCVLDPAGCQVQLCFGGCDGPTSLNATRLPVMLAHYPSVSSGRNFEQVFEQLALGFGKFDYGPVGNMEYYGQYVPPAYDITKITHPKIAIFYGTVDRLCPEIVVEHVMALLPLETLIFKKRILNFGHNDYVFNFNAKKQVYDDLIPLLNANHRRPNVHKA